MKKITGTTVYTEDGDERHYTGTGREPIVQTAVQKSEDPANSHQVSQATIRFLTVNLLLDEPDSD